ncbi:hypothetical protein H4582DRAFT_2111543 [Lactarius indigo]|nr:hypothetical protein H4582DRAFT_2111543 [Lactarius indigo]
MEWDASGSFKGKFDTPVGDVTATATVRWEHFQNTCSSSSSGFSEGYKTDPKQASLPHLSVPPIPWCASLAPLFGQFGARAAEPRTVNWIAYWWNIAAYMTYCDPAIPDAPKRATTSIEATLPFSALVESLRKFTATALYKWLFHVGRYPIFPRSPPTNLILPHNHVVSVRNNGFFEVQLSRADGTELNAADLETHDFGPLTFLWGARGRLIKASAVNEAALKHIESAMIAVALDSSRPTSRNVLSWRAWVCDGCNRWHDKHQHTGVLIHDVIVSDDGRSAFPGELACMDGTLTLHLNESKLGSPSPSPSSSLTLPAEIVLTSNDAILADVLHYDAYLITQFKTSPDWSGRQAVTYKSAETRKFQRGRTEVSKAWIDTMVDPNATDALAQRAALFRSAVARHALCSVWAADRIDRHLFGLKKVSGFSLSNHWDLSTSQLSSKYLDKWNSYPIGDDYVRWTIANLKFDSERFKACFADAATETQRMMEHTVQREGIKAKL